MRMKQVVAVEKHCWFRKCVCVLVHPKLLGVSPKQRMLLNTFSDDKHSRYQ